MTLSTASGRTVVLEKRLGVGARGWVFTVADDPDQCAKFYTSMPPDAAERVVKLVGLRLTAFGPGLDGVDVAWPIEEFYDETGTLRGFLMRKASGRPLELFLDPNQRIAAYGQVTWAANLAIATGIAQAFEFLHRAHITVADISPGNVIVEVSGTQVGVVLIDCDSVQFYDHDKQQWFTAPNFTPQYGSPEVLAGGTDFLDTGHDLFGLALLICQLLMEGQHPYEGVPTDGPDEGVEGNIRSNACRLFFPERLRPVSFDLPLETLPAPVVALARRAFVDGHADPAARPSAGEWVDALRLADVGMLGCLRNTNHFYQGEFGTCLWCLRRDKSLGDNYPAPVGDRSRVGESRRHRLRRHSESWPPQDQKGGS